MVPVLTQPIDAIVFDCDGTLSHIEGIEVLAEQHGVGDPVRALTEQAMSHSGITPSLYAERLALVQPTRTEVIQLAQQYYAARSPNLHAVLHAFQALGKAIYVVSAGVNPAVTLFAAMLNIPADCVYAVDLRFSTEGQYTGYDTAAYPANAGGKRELILELKARHPRIVHVGDGMNDAVVADSVTRFIGYGGVRPREKVAALSFYYLRCASMAPLLPLCLTASEVDTLSSDTAALYQQGLEACANAE